jgi:DHA1 family bicyclomycin/chloramphenicol resistance-like MFS transporter
MDSAAPAPDIAPDAVASAPDIHVPAKAPLGMLLLLGALTAFAPMSIDMYLPAIPTIGRSFGASPAAAQATLAAFLAGLAIGQFFYGPASDRWGRRGPILFGVALYVAASVACALAPSVGVLAAARFVQALGGCAGPVIARAVVRDRFGHRDSARVLSLLMLVMGLAPIIAPMVGSLMLTVTGWRAIFWVLTAFGALVLLSSVVGLEESRSAQTALAARSEHPIRGYLALLRQPRLMGFVLAGALNSASMFAYISASPGLLITRYGVSPSMFGWVFGLNAAAFIAMSQANRYLLRRRTPEQIVALTRPISLVFASLLLLTALTGFGGLWGILIPLFFVMGSFGFIGPNTTAAGLNVDANRAGSISALMGGAQFGIGALAAGLTTAVHDTGPTAMAVVILGCILGSTAALYLLALPKGERF